MSGADPDEQEPAAVSAAADELYAAEPAEFTTTRTRLAGRAREAGDADAARRITALRKPTMSAWLVNRYVLANPDTVHRLRDLNERLQTAHADLDAAVLRELTTERRQTIDELTRAALDAAGQADAPTALREDVSATFDAAVADPQVAGRLGRLQRAEHWSGFGVASGELPAGSPALRLLRGGRDQFGGRDQVGERNQVRGQRAPAPAPQKREQAERPAAKSAAERKNARERERSLRAAQQAFADADAELGDARSTEQAARERVRELTEQLTEVQRQLADAKRTAEERRRQVKAAQGRQREARSALSRAERRAAE